MDSCRLTVGMKMHEIKLRYKNEGVFYDSVNTILNKRKKMGKQIEKCCLTCGDWTETDAGWSYCSSEGFNSSVKACRSVYDFIAIVEPETFFCKYYFLKKEK